MFHASYKLFNFQVMGYERPMFFKMAAPQSLDLGLLGLDSQDDATSNQVNTKSHLLIMTSRSFWSIFFLLFHTFYFLFFIFCFNFILFVIPFLYFYSLFDICVLSMEMFIIPKKLFILFLLKIMLCVLGSDIEITDCKNWNLLQTTMVPGNTWK